jgi:hypothetical protein
MLIKISIICYSTLLPYVLSVVLENQIPNYSTVTEFIEVSLKLCDHLLK